MHYYLQIAGREGGEPWVGRIELFGNMDTHFAQLSESQSRSIFLYNCIYSHRSTGTYFTSSIPRKKEEKLITISQVGVLEPKFTKQKLRQLADETDDRLSREQSQAKKAPSQTTTEA